MVLPVGYRFLDIGEIIKRDDLYWSTTEKWERTQISGVPVIQNGVIWCRKR